METKSINVFEDKFNEFKKLASSSYDKKEEFSYCDRFIKHINLNANENVKIVAPITSKSVGIIRDGLLVATNRRILIALNKGFDGINVHTFHLKKISSIDYKMTFLYKEVCISTDGDKDFTFASNSPDTLNNELRLLLDESFSDKLDPNFNKDESLEKIEKLFELKESGAIDEAEFKVLKTKIINS